MIASAGMVTLWATYSRNDSRILSAGWFSMRSMLALSEGDDSQSVYRLGTFPHLPILRSCETFSDWVAFDSAFSIRIPMVNGEGIDFSALANWRGGKANDNSSRRFHQRDWIRNICRMRIENRRFARLVPLHVHLATRPRDSLGCPYHHSRLWRPR